MGDGLRHDIVIAAPEDAPIWSVGAEQLGSDLGWPYAVLLDGAEATLSNVTIAN
jgi:hypothetical protein